MKRTPDAVSKARQKAGQEIKEWRAVVQEARGARLSKSDLSACEVYCKARIELCQKELARAIMTGRKEFWSQ